MYRDGKLSVTPDRRGDRHMYYSRYGSDRHYDHHYYHPYRRSNMGYFLDEFKKSKTLTFEFKDSEA